MKDCVFCKIVKGEIKKKIIFENDNFISFADINPVTPGHSLVISKEHFETFLNMPDTLGQELSEAVKKTALKILKENNAEGFKLVNNNKEIAGQVVPHLHFHIIPRKKDDMFNGEI